MTGNRQAPKLEDIAFDTLMKEGFFCNKVKVTYISTDEIKFENKKGLLPHHLVEVLIKRFLQAVIDDDRQRVKYLLDQMPQLLLVIPSKALVIESQCTWRKFKAADALTTAVTLKQIKMTQLLLSYYDKLPQTPDVINAKTRGLSAWQAYEVEFVIPHEYFQLAESLVDVFRNETFPNGIPGPCKDDISANVQLSEPTESALLSLLNILVPKEAMSLDECIDVDLLLSAFGKAYLRNLPSFHGDWAKLDVLCIRVMGLIKSALIPEAAKIFCYGLYDVIILKKTEISPLAAAHKLKRPSLESEEDFYRKSRDSRDGHGFVFVSGMRGDARDRPTHMSLAGAQSFDEAWTIYTTRH